MGPVESLRAMSPAGVRMTGMPDPLTLVTDELLVEDFGAETVRRARAYAAEGAVRQVRVVDRPDLGRKADDLILKGLVVGSRGQGYHVTVEVYADHDDGWAEIVSECSCPVGFQCKHGAAALLVLCGDSGTPGTVAGREVPLWERELATALDDLEPPTPAAPKRLALQASLHLPTSRWSSVPTQPSVRLRLVQQGAKDNWIKTGIKWSDTPVLAATGRHDPAQVELLTRLHAGLGAARFYSSSVEEPGLDEFGPRLWPLLIEAEQLGIPLVLGTGLAGITVLDAPLAVTADAVASAAGTRLRLGIQYDEELWSGARVLTVGLPAHGVALLRGDPPRFAAVVAPLSRPLPASSVKLLRADEPLVIPTEATTRLADGWLPRLARSLEVTSSDGSVTIPEPPRPRLILTVTWDSATAAELRWEWSYGKDWAARSCLLDSADRLDGLRDSAGEREVLSRLPTRPAIAVEKITGPDALELAIHTLPAIKAVDDVEVVELERPDFRESFGTIGISFDAVEPEPGDEPPPVDWLDLMVTIRVEGEQVPLPAVLEALTLGHDHVVLPSGLYIGTGRPEFAALDDLVRAAAELTDHQRDDRVSVGAHDLGLWAQLAELGVVDAQAADWVAKARALRDLSDLPTPEPTGITSALRSYQRQGFHWLAFLWQHGLGGILADDMGLGKTLQVLALVAHARAAGSAPFLVVAPSSVVSAWQSEGARHAPGLNVRVITASRSRRGAGIADVAEGADLVVTTYTLLRLEEEQYAEVEWGGVVLDEAQHVKNHQGRTYRAVRQLEAPFKLAVTGTPFENRLMELWALLSITTPGLYPWPQKFGQLVAGPVEKRGDERALRRFRQRIRPFLLRRTKELVAGDLPPKQEQVLELELAPKHRRVYDTHLQKERQKILGLLEDFDQNRVAIFSALTRLRMLALDASLVDPELIHVGSAKLEALVDHLHELHAEGHRALVFSQFTSYLGRVRDRLEREGIETSYLDGRTRRRGEVIEQWRRSHAAAFLISLKAGGVGLTLTEADYVFVLDPWWNPATEAQAVDRAHRIGQRRPVIVYRRVSANTIEDKVMQLKARKADLFAQVVDGDGLMSAGIDAEDIRGLFSSD